MRCLFSACATSFCNLSCSCNSPDASTFGGADIVPSSQLPHGVVYELCLVSHERPITRSLSSRCRQRPLQTRYRQSVLVFKQRRCPVESSSGSIGKLRT